MKHSWILAAALLAGACSPQVYPLYMDVRNPSSSGLDLNRKELAIVYRDGTNAVDSLFDRHASSALARSLEEDYFGGAEKVGIFRVPDADSMSVRLMHSLVMDTGGDVVFVLKSSLGEPVPETNQMVKGATSPDSAFVCPVAIPVKTHLDVYDSMGEDKVHSFNGSAVLRPLVYNNGLPSQEALGQLALRSLGKEADIVGQRISTRFLSNWVTENFSFYYFDVSSDAWIDGIARVMEGKMAAAVDAWSPLVKRGSALRRACACYNIAQAFYLMEDYDLCRRWLDEAEKLENVSLAPGLRKRLAAHLEKK